MLRYLWPGFPALPALGVEWGTEFCRGTKRVFANVLSGVQELAGEAPVLKW